MVDSEQIQIKLNDVWRTCNKIRATVHKIGLNLWDYFKPLDPNGNTLISESKFVNVIGQQLRGVVGLSEQEIAELTDYFRVQDGRIAYIQLCDVIHSNVPDHSLNPNLVSGLEWEDPLHKNRLSTSEHRRLCVLLMKIAQSVRIRELVIRPYFQDYELVAKNTGTVTLAHFSRVLHYLGILLSEDDFLLLVKRFIKDSYTVNYIAFLEEIEKIVQYLDKFRLIDFSDDVRENFPGRLIDAALPKLPRPEVGNVNIGELFGKETSFHPVLQKKKLEKDLNNILLRIKKHVLERQLRVVEYFAQFDLLRSGFVTKAQFIRGLDALGIVGRYRVYLSEQEIQTLCDQYADENDPSRVDWKTFEGDIEEVCTVSCLDKKPYEIVESPPQEVVDLLKDGQAKWQDQSPTMRSLCEEALSKVKAKILKRRLYLEQFFKDCDKLNIGYVTRQQMRQVLLTNGILLSDEEMYALERRYNDDMGFNYLYFLNEADPKEFAIPRFEEFKQKVSLLNEPVKPRKPTIVEKDIVQVIAKVKGIAVRRRARIIDFMKGYDCHNELHITEVAFRRGLDAAGIFISVPEVDLLCNVFKSPLRPNYIDYKLFCKTIEEVFYQPCLERSPLVVPLQHLPSTDGPVNFLNFEERTSVSKALEILAKHYLQSNLKSLFEDFDRCKCGTVNQNEFLRALTVRNLGNIISSREFDLICKCFGIERGLRMEVDYRSFLNNLEILSGTNQYHPF